MTLIITFYFYFYHYYYSSIYLFICFIVINASGGVCRTGMWMREMSSGPCPALPPSCRRFWKTSPPTSSTSMSTPTYSPPPMTQVTPLWFMTVTSAAEVLIGSLVQVLTSESALWCERTVDCAIALQVFDKSIGHLEMLDFSMWRLPR